MGYGRRLERFDACDAGLKSLATMAVAAYVGCSWCLDFTYFAARHRGLDLDKAREVPRWRESDAFTPLEREVLAYAEAISQTPPAVTDEMVASLLAQLGPAGVLELTAMIGFENATTRGNIALGIESEGFAAACGMKPLARPTGVVSGS